MALEFTYDGTIKAITASEDCSINFTIQGAGGGGGGNDDNSGSAGLPGTEISGSIPLKAGETVYCAVGGKGLQGRTTPGTGGSAGGVGGYALDGFSGGTGGRAGTSGWSGGGGGGGGATVLYKLVDGQRQYIAIAAGGGGGGGGGDNSQGYIKSILPYGVIPGPTVSRSSYLGGVSHEGCGPAIGFGYLGDIKYVTTYQNVSAQWWRNGIHVRTGGAMGGGDPTSGSDSQGWPIREIIVYENGVATYSSYNDWFSYSGATWPSDYKNLGVADEQYLYGDGWAGGGDYWAVYSFAKPVSVATNIINFSGVIPLIKTFTPNNGPKPTQDLVLIGKNVTQDQLSKLGITTDKSSLQVIEAGQTVSWDCSYVADHNFDVGYWIWGSSPSAAGVTYLHRATHSDSGRQSAHPSSSFSVPQSFTSTSVLVFGVGDRWSSCPTGANSITTTASITSTAFYTRGGQGKNHSGDGGGAGGGGAGWPSGRGGSQPSGDNGAMSGSTGYSINYSLPSTSRITRSSAFLNNGSGGDVQNAGYDGYAAFSSIQIDINIKVGSSWQKPTDTYYMQNGSWTPVKEIYYRQNDDWVKVYGDTSPDYTSQAATFNNTSGPAVA